MEDNTLFMLCDPKKCKQQQNNMDVYLNNYQIHTNNLEHQSDSSSDIELEKDSPKNIDIDINLKNDIPEYMVEVIEHINHIDLFILNHKYDSNMEKISDYLIDLLFLIKSKKK
tara:strand:+ start:179 stop:517 length:339 start_codon:yes stop_codon:yes gene_type:complete